MIRVLIVCVALAAACVIQPDKSRPLPAAGAGLVVDAASQTISVDTGKVPLVTFCGDGQVVERVGDAWTCVDVPQLNGSPAWETIKATVAPVDVWPGMVPYARISNAPVIDWEAIEPSVGARVNWPGLVPYGRVTNAPHVDWATIAPSITPQTLWPGAPPYTDSSAQAAVTWGTVKGSVQPTDPWPGRAPYTDLQAQLAVSWSTVKGSVLATDPWPGKAPYTDTQAQAAVTWSSVKGSVQPTDPWPGKAPYTDAQAKAAVSWTTVKGSIVATDVWPGKARYTDTQAQAAVTWNTVKGTVQPTDVWPGKSPASYTDDQARAAVTWDSVKTTVLPTDPWPGATPPEYTDAQAQAAVTWASLAPSVSSTTSWPGTVPYARVTNAPDYAGLASQVNATNTTVSGLSSSVTALATMSVPTYTTFASLPANPADGQRAYVSSNLCAYAYSASAARWEVVACDFYPDWTVTNTATVTFAKPTGGAGLAVTFALTGSVATRDYFYGVDYSGSTSGANFILEAGSATADDQYAPSRIRGRAQRCGYTISGRPVCLPYLGMATESDTNWLDQSAMKMGERIYFAHYYLSDAAGDLSFAAFTSAAATHCAVVMTSRCAVSGTWTFYIAAYGTSFAICGREPSALCQVPLSLGTARGVRLVQTSATCGSTYGHVDFDAYYCLEPR